MKTTLVFGEMKAKLLVDENGNPNGIDFTMGETRIENELATADIPELAKLYMTKGKEFRENLPAFMKELKTSVLDFLMGIQAIFDNKIDTESWLDYKMEHDLNLAESSFGEYLNYLRKKTEEDEGSDASENIA